MPETLLKRFWIEFSACGILELDDAFDFLRWRLFAALARSNFLKLCQSSLEHCKIASVMAPEPISPEEARRRKV